MRDAEIPAAIRTINGLVRKFTVREALYAIQRLADRRLTRAEILDLLIKAARDD